MTRGSTLECPFDRRTCGGNVPWRGACGNRSGVVGIPEVEKGGVTQFRILFEGGNGFVSRRVPHERQTYAFIEQRLHRLAYEWQVWRGRYEIPVAAAILDRQFAEYLRQSCDGNVFTFAVPAPW